MLPKKDGHPEPYALEDMISDLQARRNSLDQEDLEDPVELLKKRDKDLVLAAELGKALLERNQELTRQSEALTEEYSSKLETFDAAEVTKEVIENISNRIPRFSRAFNRRKSVISRGGYSFHEEEEE